ncbi:MAG: PorP/SprF family type IX secretion system membrane protein [Bacteroidales bacterium]|nr:PorP/SprF family type IX secretion system membrane protein [Bacteroidales bacterium]
MKKISIFAAVITCWFMDAQDMHFTQFSQTALWINPAQAGLFYGSFRGVAGFRDQWRSIGTPYTTFYVSADGVVKQSMTAQFNAGAYGVFDKAGIPSLKHNLAGIVVSSQVKLSDGFLVGAGLMTGLYHMYFNPEEWSWSSQYDGLHYNPNLPSNENLSSLSATKMDVGGGILFHYFRNASNPFNNDGIRAKIGFAFFHINRPKQLSINQEDKKYMKFHLHGDASVGIPGTNTAIQPGFLFAMQGPHVEILPGLAVRYMLKEQSRYTGFIKSSAMTLGVYLRTRDAVNIITGFEFANYMLGFSYDVNISGLSKVSKGNGAMEFFVRFITPSPEKMSRRNSPLY